MPLNNSSSKFTFRDRNYEVSLIIKPTIHDESIVVVDDDDADEDDVDVEDADNDNHINVHQFLAFSTGSGHVRSTV